MIYVKNLTKQFKSQKNPTLDNIQLDVNPGEIFGVIGKSGAGKSTLLKCLNLLERPDSGSIMIDGHDLTKMSSSELRLARQNIGVIFQGFNLLDSKNVFDNVALPLKLSKKYSKAEVAAQVNNLLELVGLTDFAHKYPHNLSGGQKQRVGIARALSTQPKILLSDEATSALDPETTNSILELLLNINYRLGLTIVLITHQIEVIRKICDRTAVIDHGQIVEFGRTIDIIMHPKHPVTRKLIIEEETHKYLEMINDFYKFDKNPNNHLVLLSFIGEMVFQPILSKVAHDAGVQFSILKGELGRVKRTPFGQLLIEITGNSIQLDNAFKIFKQLQVYAEIVN